MKRQYIYLIGSISLELIGSKMLSRKFCMHILFYNMRFGEMSLLENTKLTFGKCLIFATKSKFYSNIN